MNNLESDAWQEANAQFAEDDETEVVRSKRKRFDSQAESDEATDEPSDNPK